MWLQREETKLLQQVKFSWMEKGEALAQFFKSYASLSKPLVQEMRLRDGTRLDSPEAIHLGAVELFSSFLRARLRKDLLDLSFYICGEYYFGGGQQCSSTAPFDSRGKRCYVFYLDGY